MKKFNKIKSEAEHEALEGILLLKDGNNVQTQKLAKLYGTDNNEWEFDISKQKFQIKDGNNLASFFYCSIEKSWIIFRTFGNLKLNGKFVEINAVLRSKSMIEIGNIFCFFENKIIIKKEYKKLLVDIILDTSEKKIELSKIYERLLNDYDFSHKKQNSWKNSIRCILSESKLFYKKPQINKETRGRHWAVDPKELKILDNSLLKRIDKIFNGIFNDDPYIPVYTYNDLNPEGAYNSNSTENESHLSMQEMTGNPRFINKENINFNSDNSLTFYPIDSIYPNQKYYQKNNYRLQNDRSETKSLKNIQENKREYTTKKDFDYEIASFDGGYNNDLIDELSSDFSCLSVKEKTKRRRRDFM